MSRLFPLNRLSWYWRLPAKWVAFGMITVFVCFPHPVRLWRHIQHWRDPNALIEPDAPGLAPLVDKLRAELPENLPPAEALRAVQKFVLEHVQYDWDWNTWGQADYLPTVAEVLDKGHEDCDGRAVLAASLLKKLGYEAALVTDFAHMWVRTEHGDLMGPGRQTAILATERGLAVSLRGLAELPRALAYGVAVFPAWRECIILLAAWVLLLGPCTRPFAAGVGFMGLVAGLFLVREGSVEYLKPAVWLQLVGLAALLVGVAASIAPVFMRPRRAPDFMFQTT